MFQFFEGGEVARLSLSFNKDAWSRLFLRRYTEQIIHEGKNWVRDILNNRLTQRSRRFLPKIILCTQLSFLRSQSHRRLCEKGKMKVWSKVIWNVRYLPPPLPDFFLPWLARWITTGWHIFSVMNHSSVDFFLYDRNIWQIFDLWSSLYSWHTLTAFTNETAGSQWMLWAWAFLRLISISKVNYSHTITENRRFKSQNEFGLKDLNSDETSNIFFQSIMHFWCSKSTN